MERETDRECERDILDILKGRESNRQTEKRDRDAQQTVRLCVEWERSLKQAAIKRIKLI